MIDDKKMVIRYLEGSVNGIHKILPLFEEESAGLETYIESLLFTLGNLSQTVLLPHGHEYVTLMAKMNSLKEEVAKKENGRHAVVRREVFNCISIVHNMVAKLEKSDKHE